MLRLVVLLSLLALSLACKPSSSTSSATTSATTASTGAANPAKPTKQNKREVGQAHVLVETNLEFNPALNPILEKAFKQGVEQHAHKHGVMFNHDMVQGKTEKIGHKFAMGYRILGADCEEVHILLFTGRIAFTVEGDSDAP
ncbi:hypothetical protein V3C99_008346 [Haemonchus contortus]|uniref:DUF4410 domain-containing protein n=1 Tax=Haemonchus contortus TaxID=6289 RepID=A0A7I4YP24_HAECO